MKKEYSVGKAMKEMLIWLVSIVALAALFTFFIKLFVSPESVPITFTPAHFGSPAFPLAPLNLLGGVSDNFGVTAALLMFVLIILLLFLMVKMWREFNGWSDTGEGPSIPSPVFSLTGKQRKVFVKRFVAISLFLVVVRILVAEPLVNNVSTVGKFRLTGKFLVNFNRAIAKKSVFREKEYVLLMLDALKFDGDEYFKFANSKYWAFYATKGITFNTDREGPASRELIELFGRGALKKESFERVAGVLKKGMYLKAAEVVLKASLSEPLHGLDDQGFDRKLAHEELELSSKPYEDEISIEELAKLDQEAAIKKVESIIFERPKHVSKKPSGSSACF